MMSPTPQNQVTFRAITDQDHAFLLGLYASTREWERQATSWSDADWDDFIGRQFKAQDQSYRMSFPGASFVIIQLGGVDIGRLYSDRQNTFLRIIEFSIAPNWRGRGIGTDIVRALINEADGGKVPVRLSVDKNNPAVSLYLRHGFKCVEDMGSYFALEWQPAKGLREI